MKREGIVVAGAILEIIEGAIFLIINAWMITFMDRLIQAFNMKETLLIPIIAILIIIPLSMIIGSILILCLRYKNKKDLVSNGIANICFCAFFVYLSWRAVLLIYFIPITLGITSAILYFCAKCTNINQHQIITNTYEAQARQCQCQNIVPTNNFDNEDVKKDEELIKNCVVEKSCFATQQEYDKKQVSSKTKKVDCKTSSIILFCIAVMVMVLVIVVPNVKNRPATSYSLIYEATEGGYISGEKEQTVQEGKSGSYVVAVPNAGYVFVSWSDGVTKSDRKDENVRQNKTITAQFQIISTTNTYTLQYHTEYGGVLSGSTNQTVNEGQNATTVVAIANEGYTFDGWSDGVQTATRTDLNVMANLSVTAKWKINNYTLIFDSDGGSHISQVNANYNTIYTLPKPTKDNYVFEGWMVDGVIYEETITVKSNITLKAIWSVKKYTITFVTGFSDIVISPQSVSFNQSYTLPRPRHDNYTFKGWDNGVSLVEDGVWTYKGNMTLFARWDEVMPEEPEVVNDFLYEVKNDNTIKITKYTGDDEIVQIPSKINNSLVTEIGGRSFEGNGSITSVVIPNGVMEIGGFAFSRCSYLTEITIPASVSVIYEMAFIYSPITVVKIEDLSAWCNIGFDQLGGYESNPMFYGADLYLKGTRLTQLTIPLGIREITKHIFYGCTSIETLIVPSGVTCIDGYAFANCSNLTSAIIPSTVTRLGGGIFSGCNSLQSITLPFVGSMENSETDTHFGYIFGANSYNSNTEHIPSSLKTVTITGGTTIYSYAFSCYGNPENVNIQTIILPDTIINIGSCAFENCRSLQNIDIPSSVQNIGSDAFGYCTGLKTVTFEKDSNLASVGIFAFQMCSSLNQITIPISVTSIKQAVFSGCNNLTIYCEAISKPSGWHDNWNSSNCPVYWGV